MKYIVNPKNPRLEPFISFDTEYTEKNIRRADLLSISIGVSPDITYIFDPQHFGIAIELLQYAARIYTWNGIVDWYMVGKSGTWLNRHTFWDAMLMEHLIDERLDHGLGDFALRECNDNYKEEFWSAFDNYQDAPPEVAYEYEMRDGCYTFIAGDRYSRELAMKHDLVRHVHNLQWALFDTEVKGLRVNRKLMEDTKLTMGTKIAEFLPKLRSEFEAECSLWELNKWQEEIAKRKTAKGKQGVKKPVFTFTSDKQLSWLIYEALECPVIAKTKSGNPSTSFDTLQELSVEQPALRGIVEYKDVKAVYATFVEGMLERVETDDRIYPSFFINGTATGRISHANPNMGNLPKEGVIRNFFIPDEGMSLVGADYSQLEIIVEANLTEDPNLLRIILEGASKHDITAQGLGIPRDQAKTLNFALQYGAGVSKVQKILGISAKDANDVFNQYWVLYGGVKKLKDKTAWLLSRDGRVTNLFGRTRHFGKPSNPYEKAQFERQAYNFLIQGVGADITNRSSYLIAEEFLKKGLGRFLFSVHDEILCESKNSLHEESKACIVRYMESVSQYLNFKYPLQAKAYGPLEKWSKT